MSDPRGELWMQTYSGVAFYPLDPHLEDILDLDIAHALSMLCRYGGHTNRFYSVAEHCVLMSEAVSPENALWALLHDAAEAYMQDLVRPIKTVMSTYREAEDRLLEVILVKYNVYKITPPQEVKTADNRIFLDEREALLTQRPQFWHPTVEALEPLGVQIMAWTPEEAREQYLTRLWDLTRRV